jgi:Lipase (class 3)
MLWLCCVTLLLAPPALGGYSLTEDEGRHYLMYAYSAYCSAEQLSAWTCEWCGQYDANLNVTATIYVKQHNLFGFVGVSHLERSIVVSMRGTQASSLKNWIINLKSAKDPVEDPRLPGARVEAGFLEGWKSMAGQVDPAIDELMAQFPNYTVVATGHSLGGALAVGAAVSVHERHPGAEVRLVTFGQPRVGDAVFGSYLQKFFNNSMIRFTQDRDPVPHLPPSIMGYRHAPREEWMRKGTLHLCDPLNGEDPECSDSLDFDTSISAHLHYLGIYENGCVDSKRAIDPYPDYEQ